MNDLKMIDLFFARDPSALTEAAKVYGAYCRTVAANILDDPRDAEEAVNDALLEAWESIPPNRPQKLGAYLAKLTHNISLNKSESLHAGKRWSGQADAAIRDFCDTVSNSSGPEDEVRLHELTQAITEYLKGIPAAKRRMFMDRYWYYDDVSTIAKRLGKSPNNVAVQLHKLRAELKNYLTERGFSL